MSGVECQVECRVESRRVELNLGQLTWNSQANCFVSNGMYFCVGEGLLLKPVNYGPPLKIISL